MCFLLSCFSTIYALNNLIWRIPESVYQVFPGGHFMRMDFN